MDYPSSYDRWPAFEENDIGVVWTQGAYRVVKITYVEPLPESVPLRQDLGAINAGQTVTQTLITGIQLSENMLLQCRIRPKDDIDLLLWLQRGSARMWIRNSHARIPLSLGAHDPDWKSTTFFVIAKDRDLYVEARNLSDYNLTQSRLQIWGWRASVQFMDEGNQKWEVDGQRRLLLPPGAKPGTTQLVSPYNGRPIWWISAEGRAA